MLDDTSTLTGVTSAGGSLESVERNASSNGVPMNASRSLSQLSSDKPSVLAFSKLADRAERTSSGLRVCTSAASYSGSCDETGIAARSAAAASSSLSLAESWMTLQSSLCVINDSRRAAMTSTPSRLRSARPTRISSLKPWTMSKLTLVMRRCSPVTKVMMASATNLCVTRWSPASPLAALWTCIERDKGVMVTPGRLARV